MHRGGCGGKIVPSSLLRRDKSMTCHQGGGARSAALAGMKVGLCQRLLALIAAMSGWMPMMSSWRPNTKSPGVCAKRSRAPALARAPQYLSFVAVWCESATLFRFRRNVFAAREIHDLTHRSAGGVPAMLISENCIRQFLSLRSSRPCARPIGWRAKRCSSRRCVRGSQSTGSSANRRARVVQWRASEVARSESENYEALRKAIAALGINEMPNTNYFESCQARRWHDMSGLGPTLSCPGIADKP